MAVSDDDVRHLARLAHLELTGDEVTALRGHMERLLGYIARIQAMDVTGVPEAAPEAPAEAPLRPDTARPGLPREIMTAGAPSAAFGLFEVPRVIASRGPGPAGGETPGDEPEMDEVAP